MTHGADIGIRLDAAGPFAAMQLAGDRGDMAGFKKALAENYGPMAKRVFHSTIDKYCDYILKQAELLMDATSDEDIASLVFWAELAHNHEERTINMKE